MPLPYNDRQYDANVDIPNQVTESGFDLRVTDDLVTAYFLHIHADLPVLHEATFRATYESLRKTPTCSDRVFLCILICMCMLAHRLSTTSVTRKQTQAWWRQVLVLLPTVFFTSSIPAVQALLLAALHLHNTNHRDACWNLTGTAVRIAHATGMHNDEIKSYELPLTRELRKTLRWTLLHFKQLQIPSCDRPSAICDGPFVVTCPNESLSGLSGVYPPNLFKYSSKLVLLLAAVCRSRKFSRPTSTGEGLSGALSPVASTLRNLRRWKALLPSHLTLEALDLTAPSYRRPLILMHANYHYSVIVLTRSTLLQRATVLSQETNGYLANDLTATSEICRTSGRALSNLVLKLDSWGKFNAVTWFDSFYAITASLALAIDVVCNLKDDTDYNQPLEILHNMASVMQQHVQNRMMPGTLRKWATLIGELNTKTVKYCANNTHNLQLNEDQSTVLRDATLLMDLRQAQDKTIPDASADASHFSEQQWLQAFPEDLPPPIWSHMTDIGLNTYTGLSINDWHWEDIDAILNAGHFDR